MTREARARWMAGALFGGGFAVGVAYGLVEDSGSDFASWLLAVAVVALVVACVGWWRLLDEAQQEAHKWAWYWGGSAGLMVAFVFAIAATQADDAPWRTWADATSDGKLVAFGVIACIVLQCLGYGVAWVGWWLRHR